MVPLLDPLVVPLVVPLDFTLPEPLLKLTLVTEWVARVSTPTAKVTYQSKPIVQRASQFRRTEIADQTARQVLSIEVLKAKRKTRSIPHPAPLKKSGNYLT